MAVYDDFLMWKIDSGRLDNPDSDFEDADPRIVELYTANMVPFDFPDVTIDEELIKTFVGYVSQVGEVSLPYEQCLFFIRPNNKDVFLVLELSIGEVDRNGSAKIFGVEGGGGTIGQAIMGTCYVGHRHNGFAELGDIAIYIEDGKVKVSRDPYDDKTTNDDLDVFVASLSVCLTRLMMKQFSKSTVHVPPKVAAKRGKANKPFFRSHVVVDLMPAIKARLSSQNGGGYTVRPHWRRGHWRMVHTKRGDKQVWIEPVMVNMDTPEAKPVYTVMQ